MAGRFSLHFLLAFSLTLTLAACTSGGPEILPPPKEPTVAIETSAQKLGTLFVVATDAPLASVLAFQVTLTGMTLSDGSQSVAVLSEPQAVEFARLLGLRTLLGLSEVPAGTYTSVSLTLANPVISYLDLSTSPASVENIAGQLTQSSLTVPLQPPLVVSEGGLAGLHMHFNLRASLAVDAAGQLTGEVDPHIRLRPIPPEAEDAYIDELRGGVSEVEVSANRFRLQTRRGRRITIYVNDQTEFDAGESLATLDSNTIVQVAGRLQLDASLLADEVHVLTRERFLLGGLVLDPDPAVGPAERVYLLVREELPDLPDTGVGQVATGEFEDDTRFGILHHRLPLTDLLFNRAALVRGQRITLGGRLDTTTSPPDLRTRGVILHLQGFHGDSVPGSTRIAFGNTGSFLLRVHGLGGYLFGQPLRVRTSARTRWRGLMGLNDLADSEPIDLLVCGLLLRHSGTGEPVLVARRVVRPSRLPL